MRFPEEGSLELSLGCMGGGGGIRKREQGSRGQKAGNGTERKESRGGALQDSSVSIRIGWWRLRAAWGLGWMFLSEVKEGFGKPWIGLL